MHEQEVDHLLPVDFAGGRAVQWIEVEMTTMFRQDDFRHEEMTVQDLLQDVDLGHPIMIALVVQLPNVFATILLEDPHPSAKGLHHH